MYIRHVCTVFRARENDALHDGFGGPSKRITPPIGAGNPAVRARHISATIVAARWTLTGQAGPTPLKVIVFTCAITMLPRILIRQIIGLIPT